MRLRYPRTPHLPWSPGATSDDVRVSQLGRLHDCEVVVTEKLDGENTTLARDFTHARSLDSAHHSSRTHIKALQARIAHRIPPGWRICGENLFARHSVPYDALPAWFVAFNVWDDTDRCLDWDHTVRFCRNLGIPTAPVLYRGPFDPRQLRKLRVDTVTCEGFVVRTTAGFSRKDFPHHVAKWVRAGHVTDTSGVHWMLRSIVPNKRGPEAALWELRSGGRVDGTALQAALGVTEDLQDGSIEAVFARIPTHGRSGDSRLAAAAAVCTHHWTAHARLSRLTPLLGHHTARQATALAHFAPRIRLAMPDHTRRAGLTSLARSVDLGLLHGVAAALAEHQNDHEGAEQVAWSEAHAEEAGLLAAEPLAWLRQPLEATLAEPLEDQLWDGIVRAFGEGRLHSPEEALALLPTLRERASGAFVRLVVGPSGSGKSTFLASLSPEDRGKTISLDDLRAKRGDRSDQDHNQAVVAEATELLREGLRARRTLTWDATSLSALHRRHVLALADRYRAATHIDCLVVEDEVLHARNRNRRHAVPPSIVDEQLQQLAWPWAHEAHTILDRDSQGERLGRVRA